MLKELITLSKPTFLVAKMGEKELPTFIFSVDAQELYCNISLKDQKVVEGDPGHIRSNQYLLSIQRHPTPDLALTGHYWKIKEMAQTGVYKQLV